MDYIFFHSISFVYQHNRPFRHSSSGHSFTFLNDSTTRVWSFFFQQTDFITLALFSGYFFIYFGVHIDRLWTKECWNVIRRLQRWAENTFLFVNNLFLLCSFLPCSAVWNAHQEINKCGWDASSRMTRLNDEWMLNLRAGKRIL